MNSNLTKATKVREYLLSQLTEEDCIHILSESGINLEFKSFKHRLVTPLRCVSEVFKLNNRESFSVKAKLTNILEFEDKYFSYTGKSKYELIDIFNIQPKGNRLAVITPKGIITYCLCTYGNDITKKVESRVYEYLASPKRNSSSLPYHREDKLANVFKIS